MSYVQVDSHFDHPDRSKHSGFSIVFDIVHVVEKGRSFIEAHSLNGAGSLIPGRGGFFSGCSDPGSFGASQLVSSSRPVALGTSGRGDLAFFSHMTQLSAVETRERFLVAIRGLGSHFAFSESVDLCFAFFVLKGIKGADVHSIRVSGSRGQSRDSEESG